MSDPNEQENTSEDVAQDAPVEAKAEADHVPTVTVRQFIAGRADPISRAFVSCEERENRTRKLPTAEWETKFKAFLSTERA